MLEQLLPRDEVSVWDIEPAWTDNVGANLD